MFLNSVLEAIGSHLFIQQERVHLCVRLYKRRPFDFQPKRSDSKYAQSNHYAVSCLISKKGFSQVHPLIIIRFALSIH